MFKNLIKVLLFLTPLGFLVSCCHKNYPDILEHNYSNIISNADHPINQGSVFFVTVESYVPEEIPDIGGMPVGQSTGSGVGIRSGDGWTDIITAGHICIPLNEMEKSADRIFTVFLLSGEYFNGYVIGASLHPDLCIVRIKYERPIIKLARSNPDRGDKVYYAGYPLGVYIPNFLHFFEGYFSGIGWGRKAIWNIPVTNGSSGSAVVNSSGKLVGIVSEVMVDFHHITMGPSQAQIKQFLHETKGCEGFEYCF